MNDTQNHVITLVMQQIATLKEVSEEHISSFVDLFSVINPLTDVEKKEAIKELHSRLAIKMDRGSFVKDKNHIPWYYSAKKDIKSIFWDRYRSYLYRTMNFNFDIINSLDSSTDDMMDMIGNPQQHEPFARKGLVIGDVQSGKTSTYTALINKAADSGYKIVILLTGTIEKLRRQTQSRLDEGFVGLDSTAFIRDKDTIRLGVGDIDPSISAWAITSTSSDFNTSTASQLNGRLSGISDPILFVLKKNKSVLEKLEQWLRLYNVHDSDQKIHMPMLLIDDEADNASVNTKKEEDDPTAINQCIRKLLKLFVKSSYVGFTATPFANIFINPDTDDEMLKDDLFPRDFIYSLSPPTNYVGARGIFPPEGRYHYMLQNNDDCIDHIPMPHKKDFVLSSMPNSLKEAIASFFITNAIRDLRGQKNKHRSMLINVSIYIDVQKNIANVVENYVREFQREIKNYYLTGVNALEYQSFIFLKKVYKKYFEPLKLQNFPNEDMTFTWEQIQEVLYPAIASIAVKYVNGGNAPKNLNYDEHEETGLRLIAIGGYSLSRGLTLEGLCTSYFFRNTKMYDTLMQMGRWFGYRPGYESLCKVWLTEESADWYEYISEASDELRAEVKRMFDAGLTPTDFGLAVRSDKNSLLVTAVNKMRTAQDYVMTVSLNGKMIETPRVHNNYSVLDSNLKLTKLWLDRLSNSGYTSTKDEMAIKHPQILNVPKLYIIEYLNLYKSHPHNMEFNTADITKLIADNTDGTLDSWDIALAGGKGPEINLTKTYTIQAVTRSFNLKESANVIQLSGSKSRLGSINFAKAGLTKEEVEKIENKERLAWYDPNAKKAFSQDIYFNSGMIRNPLLVIYPVVLKNEMKDENGNLVIDTKRQEISDKCPTPIIGLSIGIPKITGKPIQRFQYKINLVKYRELLGVNDEYNEIDDTIE